MPDDTDLLQQKNKQAEPIQTAQTLREHLTSLQTWNLDEGQTLEQRRSQQAEQMIQHQQEDALALQNRNQQQLQPANANAAAPGQPVQEQAPAQQTYKQRKAPERGSACQPRR